MEHTGKLILRVSIGAMMLLHGISKLQHGVGFLEEMFGGMGLPAFFAYSVYLGEVVAPIMLIVGFKTRISALLVAFTMVVAIFMAHAGDIFTLTDHGGWGIEVQGLYLFGSLAIAMLGAGKFSIDKK